METRLKHFLCHASTFVSAAILAAVLAFPTSAWSQSSKRPSKPATPPTAVKPYSLDGQKFKVRIVRDSNSDGNKKRGLGDILSFKNGNFSSQICRRYNFEDAPYWIRVEGNKTHFLVELKSPTDGTMRWQGTIHGNILEGTMRWRRERWYWTIDATHKIRGKLQKAMSIASPPSN